MAARSRSVSTGGAGVASDAAAAALAGAAGRVCAPASRAEAATTMTIRAKNLERICIVNSPCEEAVLMASDNSTSQGEGWLTIVRHSGTGRHPGSLQSE